MRDPYLYENSDVLKNKLDIKTQDQLDDAEADYVVYRLKELAMNPLPGEYNTEHLLKMHHYIFQDLDEWAGEPRVIGSKNIFLLIDCDYTWFSCPFI